MLLSSLKSVMFLCMLNFFLRPKPFSRKKFLLQKLLGKTEPSFFLEMIQKYGADALRMGLLVGAAVGSDIRFDESKVKGYKNFANKLWNITRYVHTETEGVDESVALTESDATIRAELDALIADATRDIDEHRIYMAADKLYHYAWDRLAAKLLEESKAIFQGEDQGAKASRKALLRSLLRDVIATLHPFMPFVTEEIWKSIRPSAGLLMTAKWPGKTV